MPDSTFGFTLEETFTLDEQSATIPSLTGPRAHEWDEIVFNAFMFPDGGARLLPCHGKVVVTGEIGPDLQALKAPAKNGARIIDRGLKPCRAKIKLSVWDTVGYHSIERISAVFEPRKRFKDRTAFDIKHPAFAQMGVTKVVFEKMTPLAETGTQGMLTTEITVVEWYAPIHRKKGVSHVVVPDVGSVYAPYDATSNRSPSAGQFNRMTPEQRARLTPPSRTNTGPDF